MAEAGGIDVLGPDLKSQHALFPLEIVIDGNRTKNTPKHTNCHDFLVPDAQDC